MKKYLIVVEADTNDADYIQSSCVINEKVLKTIRIVIKEIKDFDSNPKNAYQHNWPKLDNYESPSLIYKNLTEKQIDLFNELVPYGENGVHSIESVKLYEIVDEAEILYGY